MLILKNSHQCHKRETAVEMKLNKKLTRRTLSSKSREMKFLNTKEIDAGVSSDDEDVITTVDTVPASFFGSFSIYGISITFKKRYVS